MLAVLVAVTVGEAVCAAVGLDVAVAVCEDDAVAVAVCEDVVVPVAVRGGVAVEVGVCAGVLVAEGVPDHVNSVGVRLAVEDREPVSDRVAVRLAVVVMVLDGVTPDVPV